MAVTGVDAINKFITQRTSGDRLIIRHGEIFLENKKKNKISVWQCLKAFFGQGNASMKKVAEYVHQNRNNLFPEDHGYQSTEKKEAFNAIIQSYNQNHRLIQRAREIGDIEAETIIFFGKEEWAKIGIDVKDAPPKPDLRTISKTPCDIWKGKSLGQTRMIVLVPKMLGIRPTTSNRLRKLGQQFFSDPYGFHHYEKVVSDSDGHKDIKQSYYVMMTKKVIPNSLGREMSSDLIPKGYDIPTIVEAHVCLLTQYLRGRVLTAKSKFLLRDTFTRCQGTYPHTLVGKSDEKGFSLFCQVVVSNNSIGFAPLKIL